MCFTAVPEREPCSVPYARAEKRTKIIPAREATRVPDDAVTYDTSHHPTHLRPHEHTISILKIAPSQLTSFKTELSRTFKTAVVEGATKSLEATGQVFANVLTLYGESDQSGSEELRVLRSSWKALLKEFKAVDSEVGQLIGRRVFDFTCHGPKSPDNSDDQIQAKNLRAKLGHLSTGFVTILSLWLLFRASSSRHPDDISATMTDFDSGVSSGLRQINETIEGRRRTMYEMLRKAFKTSMLETTLDTNNTSNIVSMTCTSAAQCTPSPCCPPRRSYESAIVRVLCTCAPLTAASILEDLTDCKVPPRGHSTMRNKPGLTILEECIALQSDVLTLLVMRGTINPEWSSLGELGSALAMVKVDFTYAMEVMQAVLDVVVGGELEEVDLA